jgi:hypothetical protein
MELWLFTSDNYINTITLASYETLVSGPVLIVSGFLLYVGFSNISNSKSVA